MNRERPDANMPDSRIPYRGPQPPHALDGIVIASAVPENESEWVPQQRNVWFRPLCLSASAGYWVSLLRVRRSGVLSRHRHSKPVHAHVIRGRWRYLEHDWVAEAGGYVFEPPGGTHTLVVDDDEEMVTFFKVDGAMIYVDPDGNARGYDDVFTKIELCRAHYAANGLGSDYVDRFVR